MPNNIALDGFPFCYSADYEYFKPLFAKNSACVEWLCNLVSRGVPYRQHSGLLDAALVWLQRGPFRWIHDWGRKFWWVDTEACGICARFCPADNIHMQDGLPVYSEKYIYCLRCFNYCPTPAVHYLKTGNKRAHKNPPFRGPVAAFHPRPIAQKR